MYNSFDYISCLQYQVKTQEKIIEGFKSGERYRIIQDRYDKNVNELRRMLKKVKRERDEARETTVHVRNIWFEVFDKLEEAYKKQEKKLLKELEREKEQRIRAEAKRDEYHTKYAEKNRELYDVKTELEEEKGRNKKLTAQLNRDYENSSIPSSMSENKKKITNSREKTGRKPGGQPGHAGHCRKKQEPTGEPVLLMPPQEVLQDLDFKKTKKKIIKQMVGIRVMVEVKEYHADIYYNSKTGE
ncbi:MAG: transposase, partial [Lachnospiraceae bacterium]